MTDQKTSSRKYDVAIIGAGIVGCFAAGELARIGYNVCVLERSPGPGTKSVCTGIVSRECLDLIPAAGRATQYKASSARIFSPSGKYIHVERDETQAFVLDRPELDRIVYAQAREYGADFCFSTLVSSVATTDRSVVVKVTNGNQTSAMEADIVLMACGAGTSLTRDCGLGQISEYAHGAQTELRVGELNEVEVYSGTDIAPGFFAWLVPAGGQHAKVGLLCKNSPRTRMSALLNRLESQGRIDIGPHHVRYGIVPLRPLARTYGERVLVAGDAAGQVKPTTGGGIFFGLLCGHLAVQTIDEAFKASDFSAKKLSAYQRKWHRLLIRELSIDYWAHRFYGSLGNRQIEHIFGIIERRGIHESLLTSPDITFDWHGKLILDALRHRSLQKSLEKLGLAPAPP